MILPLGISLSSIHAIGYAMQANKITATNGLSKIARYIIGFI